MTITGPAISAASPPQKPQLKEAAQAFEAVFVRNLIGSMRKASLGDDLLGNSGGSQFRDMMDARIADDIATTGSIGIAGLLIKQWEQFE